MIQIFQPLRYDNILNHARLIDLLIPAFDKWTDFAQGFDYQVNSDSKKIVASILDVFSENKNLKS